jgi:hypothetical protein
MYKVICCYAILGDDFSDVIEKVIGKPDEKKYDFDRMD